MRHCALLISGTLLGLALAACGGSMTPNALAPTVPKYTTMPAIDEMVSEKVIGSASAPNTIYEYVSFWCTTCATFHTTVEAQMKIQFVDTGRAKIVFRNLFLQGAGETTTAAMLARCVGNANFFPAADYIFAKQGVWMNSGDPGVQTTMLGFGMSQSLVDSCIANSQLQAALVQVHNDTLSQTYQLPDGTTASAPGFTHVPAIVINGVKLDSTANTDGSTSNAPTIENIAKLLK